MGRQYSTVHVRFLARRAIFKLSVGLFKKLTKSVSASAAESEGIKIRLLLAVI